MSRRLLLNKVQRTLPLVSNFEQLDCTVISNRNTSHFGVAQMLLHSLTLFAALVVFTAAQEITQDDIPSACRGICADVVTLAQRCDDTTSLSSFSIEAENPKLIVNTNR